MATAARRPGRASLRFVILLLGILQVLNESVNLGQFTRYADVLRTVRFALPTLDAMVRLPLAGHHTLQRDEVLPAVLPIVRVTNTQG